VCVGKKEIAAQVSTFGSERLKHDLPQQSLGEGGNSDGRSVTLLAARLRTDMCAVPAQQATIHRDAHQGKRCANLCE
jgi:hypothetical protein